MYIRDETYRWNHNLLGWQYCHHLTQMHVVYVFGIVFEISIFGGLLKLNGPGLNF